MSICETRQFQDNSLQTTRYRSRLLERIADDPQPPAPDADEFDLSMDTAIAPASQADVFLGKVTDYTAYDHYGQVKNHLNTLVLPVEHQLRYTVAQWLVCEAYLIIGVNGILEQLQAIQRQDEMMEAQA